MNVQKSIITGIIGLVVSVVVFVSCEKTTFNSKPGLEFISAGSYDVSQGELLSFRLRVTDKEGDISDSIWISAATNRCPNNRVEFRYKMPEVPLKNDLDAEVVIRFLTGVIGEFPIYNLNLCPGVDTVNFKFWIRDAAQNISDTIDTDQPVLIRNS